MSMAKKQEVITIIREFTRPLDKEELAKKATEMADLIVQYATDKKSAADESKERREELKQIAEHIGLLAQEVKEGSQIHEVPCYERPNYVDKTMDLVREDNGEVIESRPMSEDERTGDLFGMGGGSGGKGKAGEKESGKEGLQ
jgi:hypothetical protein